MYESQTCEFLREREFFLYLKRRDVCSCLTAKYGADPRYAAAACTSFVSQCVRFLVVTARNSKKLPPPRQTTLAREISRASSPFLSYSLGFHALHFSRLLFPFATFRQFRPHSLHARMFVALRRLRDTLCLTD